MPVIAFFGALISVLVQENWVFLFFPPYKFVVLSEENEVALKFFWVCFFKGISPLI